jgi:hypothetical protein
MARLDDRHHTERVPIGVAITGEHLEHDRHVFIGGDREILRDRSLPRHRCLPPDLGDVAAAPTAARQTQEERRYDDGTEDDLGLSFTPSPELTALEPCKAGEWPTGVMEDRFPRVDNGHMSMLTHCRKTVNHISLAYRV